MSVGDHNAAMRNPDCFNERPGEDSNLMELWDYDNAQTHRGGGPLTEAHLRDFDRLPTERKVYFVTNHDFGALAIEAMGGKP
jgi:hypothetical protein